MIVIINTGTGNFKSVQNMLSKLGVQSKLSESKEDILSAEKLILPGIGSFDSGMTALHRAGAVDAILEAALTHKTKILGICLGMQMLGTTSEEGKEKGLNLIPGHIKKFSFSGMLSPPKIPHMGWNYAVPRDGADLFLNYDDVPRFYFTHSYHFECDDDASIAAQTEYGITFTSAVQSGNIYGAQFHPEKSHRYGLNLLRNFIAC